MKLVSEFLILVLYALRASSLQATYIVVAARYSICLTSLNVTLTVPYSS
jgi:hypothetical protein